MSKANRADAIWQRIRRAAKGSGWKALRDATRAPRRRFYAMRDQGQVQRSVPLRPEDRSARRRREHVLVDLVNEHCKGEGLIVVEVGTMGGNTTRHLLEYCPQIGHAYAIDMNPLPKGDVLERLERATFIQGWSDESADKFDPKSVDLAFVDADHTEEAVLKDLAAWVPKVKPGGVIAGHDYGSHSHPGVQVAVDAFFASHPHPIRFDADKIWWTLR